MFTKVTIISAFLAICQAGVVLQDNHQAVSSQSIVRHDQPNHQINPHFVSPVLTHGPLVHNAPLVHHGPLLHSTPLAHNTGHAAPVVQVPIAQPVEDHIPAHYEFSYSVEDPHTGDHKSHHESRNGDVVKGEYSLLQPDGTIRKVEYTADDHSGFNAIVHNSAPTAHAAPAPPHGPLVHLAHVAPVHAVLHH